jgi:hypothetical protein
MFFAPTGTDPLLSAATWAAGVDAVVLKQIDQQKGTWTVGMLAFQDWPFSGPAPISTLFLQPFAAFTFKDTVTITVQTQSSYLWSSGQWTIPVLATVGKIYKFGDQLVQIAFGPKYYIDRPVTAPQWGFQFNVTLLYPHK